MAGLQGKVFAGYQLAALIGSGGIAEVYRARALNSSREVAVKIIAAEFARDAAFQERFSQYVQVAQRLGSHPHVLPLLASGVENGAHYLVTPFVRDGTLRDRLRAGFRLGPGDVAPFLRQIANALDHAHKLGVVHGNLKPSNIYLYEGRHVLLGDFGLLWDGAKLEMKRKGPGAEAVECFAPEAFAGKLTPASDIYSLGAVLFTTLTGRAPFVGKTPGDVYNAHLRQSVPPIEQIDPKLPASLRALDPVIARAMAKRPDERFPSAGFMAQVVETAVQPVGAAARAGMPQPKGVRCPAGPPGRWLRWAVGSAVGSDAGCYARPAERATTAAGLPAPAFLRGVVGPHGRRAYRRQSQRSFRAAISPAHRRPRRVSIPGPGDDARRDEWRDAWRDEWRSAAVSQGNIRESSLSGAISRSDIPARFLGKRHSKAIPERSRHPGSSAAGTAAPAAAGLRAGRRRCRVRLPGMMPGPLSGPMDPQAQPGYVPGLGPIPLGGVLGRPTRQRARRRATPRLS